MIPRGNIDPDSIERLTAAGSVVSGFVALGADTLWVIQERLQNILPEEFVNLLNAIDPERAALIFTTSSLVLLVVTLVLAYDRNH